MRSFMGILCFLRDGF